MGSLIKIWKTIPMPAGATVGRNKTVTWTAKGKKRAGKLSAIPGRVSVQSDTWIHPLPGFPADGRYPPFGKI